MSLEALREIVDEMRVCVGLPWFPAFARTGDWAIRLQAEIERMEKAEPVAWMRYGSDGNPIDVLIGDEPMEFIHGRNAPLYAAPQVPDGMVPAQTVLEWMEEAKEDMQDWACYASEYFKEKHNLHADLVKMDTRIAELRRIAAAEKRE